MALLSDLINKVKKRKDEVLLDARNTARRVLSTPVRVQLPSQHAPERFISNTIAKGIPALENAMVGVQRAGLGYASNRINQAASLGSKIPNINLRTGGIQRVQTPKINLTGLTGKPVTGVNPTAQRIGEGAANIGFSLAEMYGVGGAIKKLPGIVNAQRGLGASAGRIIAGNTLKSNPARFLIGKGVANMSQGLPYTAAYQVLNPKSNVKDIGGNLAFDVATGGLPLVGATFGGARAVGGKEQLLKKGFTLLADKKPRFEISDLASSLKRNFTDKLEGMLSKKVEFVLDDVLDHRGLFYRYPQLKNTKVIADPNLPTGTGGEFDEVANTIRLNPRYSPEQIKSSLLHEIQHGIQGIENFARGTNPIKEGLTVDNALIKSYKAKSDELARSYFETQDPIRRDSIMKQMDVLRKELSRVQDKFGMKNYKNNMAELEARTVSNRADLPDNQRYTSDPYYQTMQSEGLKPSDIIVNKGNGVSANQDLINEARKYKSAEEFIKAQGEPLYHGSTASNLKELSPSGVKGKMGENQIPGIYLTKDYDTASYYARKNGIQINSPVETSFNGKILALDSVADAKQRLGLSDWSDQSRAKIPELLKKYGYDGIQIKGNGEVGEIVVTNPNAVKTKSQLTDIWNQANSMVNPSATLSRRASELVQPQPQQKIRLKASTPQKVSIPLQSEESLGNRMVRPEASSETILPQNDIKLLPQRIVRNGEVVGDGFTIENYKHPLSRKQGEIKTQSILRQQTANEVRLAKESAERVAKTVSKVIEENTQGAIKREVTATEKEIANSANWKDKAKLAYGRETMSRNFDDIMGKDAPKMKTVYLDPVGKSEADRVRFLNKEKADFKSLGIKAYSKESKLLQLYGEGKIGLEELKTKTKDWKKVVDANTTFRQKYDDYLTKINAILIKNGYDAIPRRKDYFLHFQEIGSVLEQFGIPAKVDALPTDINGLTADFKPGKTFFSSALPRLGDKTKFDAVEGIERYLDGASKQIYHTDNIQRLRGLEKALREAHAGTNKLSNFVADLTEYTNTLAGKKSMLDRGLEAAVGRGVYTASNKLRRQVGANMVGGNVSSALTNFIPLTQAMATTSKPSFIRGMLDTISTTIRDDGFTGKSDFLTRRFGDDRLALSLFDKVADKAGWLFKTIDRFTAETIVRSKYYEGLKKGLGDTEALKRADEWAMKVMADRSIGQQPTLFNSKTMGFLTQFELEVNNQLSFIFKDLPRNYKGAGLASAMGQVFLYSYLFNSLFENATGRRPAFDPIGVAVQAYEDYTNENMKKGQATKNLVGNATAQLPFVGIVTEGGRIPVSSALPDVKGLVEGTTNWKKEGLKIASNLLLPTGGGQIRKTIEGTKAYNQGASITDKGRVRYPIQQTPANRIRTSLFGQYSTPEARSYFREGRSVLGEKQSEFFRNANPEQKQNIYEQIINNRNNNKKQTSDTEGRVFAMESGGNYVIKDDKLTYLKENGDLDSIDLNFKVPTPKQTGNTELDKKRRSAYYGDITAKINDIVKLNELGVLTDEEAEALIIDLQAQKEAFQGKSGGGNGTTKKIKIASPPKLSSIKLATPKKVKLDILKNTSSGQRIKLPQMRPPTPQSPKKTVSVKSLAKAFEKYK